MVLIRSLKVHAFVLMPNHYHLLLSPGEEDLGIVMSDWTAALTKRFNRKSGRIGHLFNGRYKWSLITDPNYFAIATKYIYRNPCKAALINRAEEYRYSTLNGIAGNSRLPFPLAWPASQADRYAIPEDPGHLMEWVNVPFQAEQEFAIRKALRRKKFRFSKRDANKF